MSFPRGDIMTEACQNQSKIGPQHNTENFKSLKIIYIIIYPFSSGNFFLNVISSVGSWSFQFWPRWRRSSCSLLRCKNFFVKVTCSRKVLQWKLLKEATKWWTRQLPHPLQLKIRRWEQLQKVSESPDMESPSPPALDETTSVLNQLKANLLT